MKPDLRKPSDVVENEAVKKSKYVELVKKVIAIQTTDTCNLVIKAEFNTKLGKIEKKIVDHSHDKYIITQKFSKLRQKILLQD